jgi:hypothetical protein
MPAQYSFVTHWELKAPLEEVWNAIYNSLEWPQWWKGVHSVVEIQPNDESGINGIRSYTWKSALPYRLTFLMQLTEKEHLKRLKGIATGELEGTGEWHFSEQNGIVHVRYDWNIVTNKKWMNAFAFLLKPVFKFNHNIVMRWGGEGLAKKLGTTLLEEN